MVCDINQFAEQLCSRITLRNSFKLCENGVVSIMFIHWTSHLLMWAEKQGAERLNSDRNVAWWTDRQTRGVSQQEFFHLSILSSARPHLSAWRTAIIAWEIYLARALKSHVAGCENADGGRGRRSVYPRRWFSPTLRWRRCKLMNPLCKTLMSTLAQWQDRCSIAIKQPLLKVFGLQAIDIPI